MTHRKKGANFMLENEVFGRSGGGYTENKVVCCNDFWFIGVLYIQKNGNIEFDQK